MEPERGVVEAELGPERGAVEAEPEVVAEPDVAAAREAVVETS